MPIHKPTNSPIQQFLCNYLPPWLKFSDNRRLLPRRRPTFQPYVKATESPAEFTIKAVVLGILFGLIFGASTVYLGLRAGLDGQRLDSDCRARDFGA